MSQTTVLKATADAIVASYSPDHDHNYGDLDSLRMGRYSDGTYTETYVNFDISEVPSHARILSATLEILQYNDGNDWQTPTISCTAYLAGGAWTEGSITFNNKPGNAAGSPSALHSVHSENTWHSWNVTAHMQAVMNGTIEWHGFRQYYTGTSDSTMKYFRSKEAGASYAPKLTIVWDYPFPQIQVGGAWRQISECWININGVWRQVTELQINMGDLWKPLG